MAICMICKKEMKYITHSHLRIHNLSIKEYKIMFPNVDMGVNGSQLPGVSERKSKSLKHAWRTTDLRDRMSKAQKEVQSKQKTKDNRKRAMIDKYGVENPMQINAVKEKVIRTNMEKCGVPWLLSSPETHKKAGDTKLKKYGDKNYNNVDKNKETKMKNHGDENYCNYDKIMETKQDRYGDPYYSNRDQAIETTIERYGTLFGPQISSPQKEIFKEISKQYPDALLEKYLKDVKISVDIFIPSLNKIIEVNGKYWHCYPEDWHPTDMHPQLNMTAEHKWKLDEMRVDKLKKAGYDVEIIWV